MKTNTELARQAGIRDCTCDGTRGCLERFAALVRADEREACAKMCDDAADNVGPIEFDIGASLAAAIRARGQA